MTEATTSEPPRCAVAACDRHPEGVVCSKHRAELVRLLEDTGLPTKYVELNIALRERRRPAGDVVVSMSRAKVLPIGAEARAAQEKAVQLVTAAEDALRDAEGWMPRRTNLAEGRTLQGACRVLLPHLDELLALPGAGEWADRMIRLGRRCDFATGNAGPSSSRSEAPCPHCGRHAVIRRDGTDQAACGACGEVVNVDAIDRWLAA